MTSAIRTALCIFISLYYIAIPSLSAATDQESTPQITNSSESSTKAAALAQLDHQIALQPDRVDLRFERARVFEALEQTEAAMREYRWLLNHYPERPEAYNNMARLMAKSGELEQAIALLEQGLVTHPVYQLMFENMRTLFDSMAQQAYRAALNEPESNDETVALNNLVSVELKGIASLETQVVVDVDEPRRANSTTSSALRHVDMPLESGENRARQVASRDE